MITNLGVGVGRPWFEALVMTWEHPALAAAARGTPGHPRPAQRHQPRRAAGFIGVDGIRMLLEKIFTLILHFNFYANIILVFNFIYGILFFLDYTLEPKGINNAL